ncbi:MAG: type IV secretion IcmS family protein [Coxiellaceae bacterium]|nr:type IV secretion IcmS family protein [Coxiellaceae bacterium]
MELGSKLSAVAKQIGAHFTLKGRPITYEEAFADTGLLPGLARRADQLASLCLGYGLGATFDDVEDALLGIKVSFDEFTPDTLRLLCITDVLYEMIKMSPSAEEVALDELMYD